MSIQTSPTSYRPDSPTMPARSGAVAFATLLAALLVALTVLAGASAAQQSPSEPVDPEVEEAPSTGTPPDESAQPPDGESRAADGSSEISAARRGGSESMPVARSDAYTLREDGAISVKAPGVLRNDSDRDSKRLIARKVLGVEFGELSLNKGGGFSYKPRANYRGVDWFKYRACEAAHPNHCSKAVAVKLTVSSVSDAPVARPDLVDVHRNHKKVVKAPGVLRNDSDADGNRLAVISFKQPRHGSVSMGSSGGFVFKPDRNYTGRTNWRYWVGDGTGGRASALATARVHR